MKNAEIEDCQRGASREDDIMNIDSIRVFLDVAQRLSFAAVAEDRGVNASSISRTIAQLEDAVGVRLVQRSTRSMALTEAGEIFYSRATSVVEAFDHSVDLARSIDRGPMGTLRMTASIAFGEQMILPLLPAFREKYPDVSLELLFTDAVTDLVSEGFDLAIRLGVSIQSDLIQTKLLRTHYRVCATPEYLAKHDPIVVPKDIEQHSCVTFTLPSYRSRWRFRKRGESGAEEDVAVQAKVAIGSAISTRSATLASLGPSLLPDWLINEQISDGTLVDVFPDYEVTATDFDTAAWAIYPSRSYLPNKVRVMIDFLRAHYGQAPR